MSYTNKPIHKHHTPKKKKNEKKNKTKIHEKIRRDIMKYIVWVCSTPKVARNLRVMVRVGLAVKCAG